jgi:hypothetical protein
VSYDITTCNEIEGFDTQLALYHASSCSDYLTFELISSNDDMQGGCSISNGFSSRMFASCLVPGDAYYIQMDGWQGAIGTALLSVSTYIGEIEMFSSVNNINCPLDKSETPNGAITPYVVGSGVDFTASWTGPNNFASSDNYLSDLRTWHLQPHIDNSMWRCIHRRISDKPTIFLECLQAPELDLHVQQVKMEVSR